MAFMAFSRATYSDHICSRHCMMGQVLTNPLLVQHTISLLLRYIVTQIQRNSEHIEVENAKVLLFQLNISSGCTVYMLHARCHRSVEYATELHYVDHDKFFQVALVAKCHVVHINVIAMHIQFLLILLHIHRPFFMFYFN